MRNIPDGFNTGVKQTSAAKVKTVGRLGSSSDLEDLTAYADKTNGMQLYLNGTFNYVYKDKWFDGSVPQEMQRSLSAVKSVSSITGIQLLIRQMMITRITTITTAIT